MIHLNNDGLIEFKIENLTIKSKEPIDLINILVDINYCLLECLPIVFNIKAKDSLYYIVFVEDIIFIINESNYKFTYFKYKLQDILEELILDFHRDKELFLKITSSKNNEDINMLKSLFKDEMVILIKHFNMVKQNSYNYLEGNIVKLFLSGIIDSFIKGDFGIIRDVIDNNTKHYRIITKEKTFIIINGKNNKSLEIVEETNIEIAKKFYEESIKDKNLTKYSNVNKNRLKLLQNLINDFS